MTSTRTLVVGSMRILNRLGKTGYRAQDQYRYMQMSPTLNQAAYVEIKKGSALATMKP